VDEGGVQAIEKFSVLGPRRKGNEKSGRGDSCKSTLSRQEATKGCDLVWEKDRSVLGKAGFTAEGKAFSSLRQGEAGPGEKPQKTSAANEKQLHVS